MVVSPLKQLASSVVPFRPVAPSPSAIDALQAHDRRDERASRAAQVNPAPSLRAALVPSRSAAKHLALKGTRGLAVASLLSAGVGAVPVNGQQVLGSPGVLTPGEDMFNAYLGDWRCVTYAEDGQGDAWTKFTTPPSWYPNAVEIWWDDLGAEWRSGFLVYVDPVDATHARGDGPWLKKRYDNSVLPTWGHTDLSAEKTDEGWKWVADVKLRDSDAHWIEFHQDKFDSTGASFTRDRRVHHVDQDWWHNDTVLCTLLPNGPRAVKLQDAEKMAAMVTAAQRTQDEL